MDVTERFSSRVDYYVSARPDYPAALVSLLAREMPLAAGATVADLGCGTGKLAEPFLAAGYEVIGVEPNEPMRVAGDAALSRYPRFRSVPGRAESTGLPDASVDLVAAGQAFHWFDPGAARDECRRILRGRGHAALVWNERNTSATPFLEAYERLLVEHCPEYPRVSQSHMDPVAMERFFGRPPTHARLANLQPLDWTGVRDRLLSSSYVPLSGPGHDALLASLRDLFDRHARQGRVEFLYDTNVYTGSLGA